MLVKKDLKILELENIYQAANNDPGRFDSLAVAYYKKYNNNSGVYVEIYENKIPEDIHVILKKLILININH